MGKGFHRKFLEFPASGQIRNNTRASFLMLFADFDGYCASGPDWNPEFQKKNNWEEFSKLFLREGAFQRFVEDSAWRERCSYSIGNSASIRQHIHLRDIFSGIQLRDVVITSQNVLAASRQHALSAHHRMVNRKGFQHSSRKGKLKGLLIYLYYLLYIYYLDIIDILIIIILLSL